MLQLYIYIYHVHSAVVQRNSMLAEGAFKVKYDAYHNVACVHV